jgi:transposase
MGHFEGIDSERVIAWRAADSFALWDFLALGPADPPRDHSTILRTRRLLGIGTPRALQAFAVAFGVVRR